jgi:hypothetical protein
LRSANITGHGGPVRTLCSFKIGALELDAILPKSERRALAAALNTLLASPTFASWRQGTTLDVGAWLAPQRGRTPDVIVSVAHLDDDERALVLGVLLIATQNPMDIDYRALSNAGLWCVFRLQTDADRARVVEGLAGAGAHGGHSAAELTGVLKQLAPRWFLMRDAHGREGTRLLQPRWAMSFMRGAMTRTEIRRALAVRAGAGDVPNAAAE